MNFFRLLSLMCILTSFVSIAQQHSPNQSDHSSWYRDVAISPDGQNILFTHMGDIYSVSSKGGTALPLTTASSWEGNPVWSPDGKWIAYASDRFGNMDIFVLPAAGGQSFRLTYHSGDDIPSDFSADSSKVLFTSSRYDQLNISEDPSRRKPELYHVAISGGTPQQILPILTRQAQWNNQGDTLLYTNEPSLEHFLRKHDNSPSARDIWLANPKAGQFKQLTTNEWTDHTPVWAPDQKSFYFLSERSGSSNVWIQSLKKGETSAKQLSFHNLHPVRDLSIANTNEYAYSYHGSIYFADQKNKPKQVPIAIRTDAKGSSIINVSANDKISEFVISPDGKEVAYITRGNIFVTSVDFATTRQITFTPGKEVNLEYAPDGRSLFYASERMERWKIYKTSLVIPNEKRFYVSTKLKEQELFQTNSSVFKPKVSPNGKLIAYISDWDELRVYDLEKNNSNSILAPDMNFSMYVGSLNFSWSPDSKWLAVDMTPNGRLFFPNIAIVPADGSKSPIDISQSGYSDGDPKWHMSGGIISWKTGRFGRRDHGSHSTNEDIYAQFLTQESWDKFHRNKEQVALDEEFEKKDSNDDKENINNTVSLTTPKVSIKWKNAIDRQARLTIHSAKLAGYVLNNDASKLYYLAKFEDKYDLWSHDFREGTTSKFVSLKAKRASIKITSDGKSAVILADGKLKKVSFKEGKGKPASTIKVKASMSLDASAEREAMLHHIWQVTKDRLYEPSILKTAKWDLMYDEYALKVSAVNNNRDFSELITELVGELNVSHAYSRFIGKPIDKTGSIGAILDHSSNKNLGILIADILAAGPLSNASMRAKKGNFIVAINDVKLTENTNYYQLMLNTIGNRIRLTLSDENGDFDVVLKPVSLKNEAKWLREQWMQSRHELVEKLSGGRLGYVYIPNMSDSSYRRVYRDLFGRHYTKEAVIIDVRSNGGGDLVDWLVQLFSGRQYMANIPNGRVAQGEPLTEWVKPSIALIDQGAYSDGSCFAAAWKNLSISTVVGTPVTGTCSYAGWETMQSGDIRAGTPRLGIHGPNGKYLEHQTDHPDVLIYADPNKMIKGQDVQLAKAVEVMLKELDTNKK